MESTPLELNRYSPLVLAYIGDSVYETYIRTLQVVAKNCPVNKLHHEKVRFVKAEAQAKIVDALLPELTEEEVTIYKRGRNAKTHTVSKGGTLEEYHKATGFEALIGYLYLKKDEVRLQELMARSANIIEGETK